MGPLLSCNAIGALADALIQASTADAPLTFPLLDTIRAVVKLCSFEAQLLRGFENDAAGEIRKRKRSSDGGIALTRDDVGV